MVTIGRSLKGGSSALAARTARRRTGSHQQGFKASAIALQLGKGLVDDLGAGESKPVQSLSSSSPKNQPRRSKKIRGRGPVGAEIAHYSMEARWWRSRWSARPMPPMGKLGGRSASTGAIDPKQVRNFR